MTEPVTKLPAIPALGKVDRTLQPILSAVKEVLEVHTGKRGNPLDRVLTLRDALDSGMASMIRIGGNTYYGSGSSGIVPGNQQPDYAIPPIIEDFRAAGALQTILLSWTPPNYASFAYTEVWRALVDDLGQAVKVGQTPSFVYPDEVGSGKIRYYWARSVNKSGIVGAFNAVAGTRGETALDPAYTLTVLTGQITESQLYSNLNARINLIDLPDIGLVDKTEISFQQIETEAEATLRSLVMQSKTMDNTRGNTAAISIEQTARADGDSANAALITQVEARLNTGDYAAVKVQSQANADAVTGLYAEHTVKVDVNGYVAGFGLSNSGPTVGSEFIVLADRFAMVANGTAKSVSSITRSGSTATATSTAHGYSDGDRVTILGATQSAYNGSFVISGATANTFNYTVSGTPATPASGTIVARQSTIPFVIGTVAGKTTVAISNAAIQDAAITSAKIGSAAVQTAHIADAAINTAKIADAAITSAKIGSAQITDAHITSLAAGKITAGTINVAIELTSATVTGGYIRTSSGTGQRVTINDSDAHSIRLYNSSNTLVGYIGNGEDPFNDTKHASFGKYETGYTKLGVTAYSGTTYGLYALSISGDAVHGASGSGRGVWGYSTSNTAVYGSSDSGIGVHATSTDNVGLKCASTNKAALNIQSRNNFPASPQVGDIFYFDEGGTSLNNGIWAYIRNRETGVNWYQLARV